MEPDTDLQLPPEELQILVRKAEEWAILNGICMRSKDHYDEGLLRLAPLALIPSFFPRQEFEKAKNLQELFNEVIHTVAYNHQFLCETLEQILDVDEFTAKLFSIYQKVYEEGIQQDLSLGLFRADYMLDTRRGNKIKQVEINTISSSFGGLAQKVEEYQKFILTELGHQDKLSNIPRNHSATGLSLGLEAGWRFYGNDSAAVLFVEEVVSCNVFDQRILEFKLKDLNPEILIIRHSFAALVNKAKLGPNNELVVDGAEIALVYYRTGYVMDDYSSEREWDVRLLMEKSKAIKCPSIRYHLAGTKKVQQKLSESGVLESLITDPNKQTRIRDVFVGMYALDLSEEGNKIIEKAVKDPRSYVLKPQLEGGGNNFYGNEMKEKLESMKSSKERTSFIIMERMYPPIRKNHILRGNKKLSYSGEVISELGIYGVVLGNSREIAVNREVGYLLRTKPASENEGGIIKGVGALDGPLLS